MTNLPPLNPGSYYHIYNRANGSENLFREEANYLRFLELYDKYISPVADTFAWVLMPNHFHVLAWIKEGMYYKYSKEDFSNKQTRQVFQTLSGMMMLNGKPSVTNLSASAGPDGVNPNGRKKANPTSHFSHLFNAYAKYVNDKYDRHGSLFQRPFKRKPIDDENYLQQVVLYIHNNPVHHGFVSYPEDYFWSSYHTFISPKPTKLRREIALEWFDDVRNFKEVHRSRFDHAPLEAWLEEDRPVGNEVLKVSRR